MFNSEGFSDMMARKSAFPSEKTRVSSTKTLGKVLETGASGTAVAGGMLLSIPNPIAKVAGEILSAISLGLTGMNHLNNLMSGSFSGQDFAVDVVLDRTRYVEQPFFEALYDETFSKISDYFGQ